jgi:phenylalanyl-tRNA synthetase beta subunit
VVTRSDHLQLIDPKQFELFNPGVESLPLANPISNDMAAALVLWPGLVKALHNLNRQQDRAVRKRPALVGQLKV